MKNLLNNWKNHGVIYRLITGIVTLGVFGLVIYLGIVRPIQVRVERANFEAAGREIQQARQKIEAKIGPAQSVKEERSCDRANQKFSEGPLSCMIALDLSYGSMSSEKARELSTSAASLFSGLIEDDASRATEPFAYSQTHSVFGQTYSQDMRSFGPVSCFTGYTYNGERNTTDGQFQISLICSGHALTEHYPLKD